MGNIYHKLDTGLKETKANIDGDTAAALETFLTSLHDGGGFIKHEVCRMQAKFGHCIAEAPSIADVTSFAHTDASYVLQNAVESSVKALSTQRGRLKRFLKKTKKKTKKGNKQKRNRNKGKKCRRKCRPRQRASED
jgi:hypothetical protein